MIKHHLIFIASGFLVAGAATRLPAEENRTATVSPGQKKPTVVQFSGSKDGMYSFDIKPAKENQTIEKSDFWADYKGSTLWKKNSETSYSVTYLDGPVPPGVGVEGTIKAEGNGGGGNANNNFDVMAPLAIIKPNGLVSDKTIRNSFNDGGAPYYYDWQGVTAKTPGSYKLTIQCEKKPSKYGITWSLPASCGKLADVNKESPAHTPPDSVNGGYAEGTLSVALDDLATVSKSVRIYRDHFERDQENFAGVKDDCRKFKMPGGTKELAFVCHDSTTHFYKGAMYTGAFWENWNLKKSVQVTHKDKGGGTHPDLGELKRGDVVAYYDARGVLMHSQTCTGDGTKTFGANNEPLPFPGSPLDQSWKWATSTAGDWANNLWLPGTPIMPVTIKVYAKP